MEKTSELVSVQEAAEILGQSRQNLNKQLKTHPDWYPKPSMKSPQKGRRFKRKDIEALKNGTWKMEK